MRYGLRLRPRDADANNDIQPIAESGGDVFHQIDITTDARTAIDYEAMTGFGEIASIAPEWDRLLERSRCNRATSCSKWYLATPRLLPELRPLVLVARRGAQIAGLLPLWLDDHRKDAGFPDDFSDHLDIIAPDEDPEVVIGLLNFAIRRSGEYVRLVLPHLKPDSNCVKGARALGLFKEESFSPARSLSYAVLDLSAGYDAYMKTLGRKFRLNLNRVRHKAQREGLVVRELKPESFDPGQIPELFLSLHGSRFGAGTSLQSVSDSPEDWIHHLFPSLFTEGRMRVFAVLYEDRIAGIDLTMVGRSGMYAWNGGFLPDLKPFDPGKLLIRQAIEESCREGLTEYDLGWFGQEYKAHWKPAIRQIGELRFDTSS